jgi:hypothetical protein
MRPVRNVFQKLSRTEQRREGVVAYLWSLRSPLSSNGRSIPLSKELLSFKWWLAHTVLLFYCTSNQEYTVVNL